MITLQDANTVLQKAGISDELNKKWQALIETLTSYSSAIIAYSGGVDSSFLSYAAYLALGDQMVAITILSAVEPSEQMDLAIHFAWQSGFRQVVLAYEPLRDPQFSANPADRCYICKTAILKRIWEYARKNNLQVVLEGQNASDQGDYRPGQKAVAETGTFSPLAQNGLAKADIRWLARALGLSIWDQPSSPCLATRFPYGTTITEKSLKQVAEAEAFLHARGFKVVRVRYHHELARIEVSPDQIEQLVGQREDIVQYFKQIGFLYVSIDLQGYRTGSLNEGLKL
jgi:pyridinium-3,5-biscarboxylic acid mononucleotide sulfurtransferase